MNNRKEEQIEIDKIYNDIQNTLGFIPNILQLCSMNYNVLKAVWGNTKEILTMSFEEQKFHLILRLLVSNENSCEYCVGVYEGMLINKYKIDVEEIQKLKQEPQKAPLQESYIELLLFALKSFNNPKLIELSDLEDLEKLKFKPKQIFDAIHNAKYMTVINTLATTYKVEVDM